MIVMIIHGQLSGVPKLPLLLRGSVWAREGGWGGGGGGGGGRVTDRHLAGT